MHESNGYSGGSFSDHHSSDAGGFSGGHHDSYSGHHGAGHSAGGSSAHHGGHHDSGHSGSGSGSQGSGHDGRNAVAEARAVVNDLREISRILDSLRGTGADQDPDLTEVSVRLKRIVKSDFPVRASRRTQRACRKLAKVCRKRQDKAGEAEALEMLAKTVMLAHSWNHRTAMRALDRAVQLRRDLDEPAALARVLQARNRQLRSAKRHREALAIADEWLAAARRAGDWRSEAAALEATGHSATALGDRQQARAAYRASEELQSANRLEAIRSQGAGAQRVRSQGASGHVAVRDSESPRETPRAKGWKLAGQKRK